MTYYVASRTITIEVSFGHIMVRDRRCLWQISGNVHNFTPAAIPSNSDQIMANVRRRGFITQEEADILNKTNKKKLQKTMDDLKTKALR